MYGLTGRVRAHRGTYGLKMHGLTAISCVVAASTAGVRLSPSESGSSYKKHCLRSSKTFVVRLLSCFSCFGLPLYRRSNSWQSRKHLWKALLEMYSASAFARSVPPMCASRSLYHCLRAHGDISPKDFRKPSLLANTFCMRQEKVLQGVHLTDVLLYLW